MSERLILFICRGNVCRSPMAEYMLRHMLGPESNWEVCSAGLSAGNGLPATQMAVEVLKDHGIDLSGHRSRAVDKQLVDAASLIVVMEISQCDRMRQLFPKAKEKIFFLKHFDPTEESEDIVDPIGASMETYHRIYDEIEAALPGLIEFIKSLDIDRG